MSTRHRTRYSTPRRSAEDQERWKEEKEPSFMHATPVRTGLALHERIGGSPLSCCGEARCVCPVAIEEPQQFKIRVEKLTEDGFVGADIAQPFWAVDAMTARRNAMAVLGRMWRGWFFLAVPVSS